MSARMLPTLAVAVALVVGTASVHAQPVRAAADHPPVARFAVPGPGPAGAPVTVDGGRSVDPDGAVVAYHWTFGDGASADGSTTAHSYAAPGSYTVTLTVTDDRGLQDSTSGAVEVGPPGPWVSIDAGDRFTNRPDVTLSVNAVPGTAQLAIANDAAFVGQVVVPVASQVAWRLDTATPESAPRTVYVKLLDAGGQPLAPPLVDGIILDTQPPATAGVAVQQVDPIFVCTPDGPGVGGTSRLRPHLSLQATVADAGSGPAELQVSAGAAAAWRPAALPFDLRSEPGALVSVQARDRAGNVSPVHELVVPPPRVTLADAGQLPFTRGLDCPGPSPDQRIRAVRAAWRAAGRGAGNRQVLRVPGSDLAWTWYSGQGLALNWVHAGTELKIRLKRRALSSYRAAIAEALAFSTVDRAPDGRRFRVNENLFRTPDDGHPPGWRDGMGTAVLLADLLPALRPDAPEHERDLALTAAGQYLATFSVDWRQGGVLWRDRGPGEWFLEYAYRTQARVLNGFMQAVVSIDRFAKQADRLATADPRWGPLRDEARRHVVAAARALVYWLPAYDLGGGATRYSLTSGAAPFKYRLFHQVLLGLLARISYVPASWRGDFVAYRHRWGG
jgi:PKD domain/D-glucuronyl C5-epimerase C-terminus